MSEQQLDRVMQALRTSSVQPQLISDDDLYAASHTVPKRRWILWFFAALVVGAAIVGKLSLPSNNVDPVRLVAPERTIEPGSRKSVTTAPPTPQVAAPGTAVGFNDEHAIDPNSIMMLRLNPEELRALGIHVSDDSVSVESVVTLKEASGLSELARRAGCDTSDPSTLLMYTISYREPTNFDVRVDSCTSALPHRPVVEWVTAYSIDAYVPIAGYSSSFATSDVWMRILNASADRKIIPIAKTVSAVQTFLSSRASFERNRKPIVIVVPATERRTSYMMWIMPTREVHAALPARCHAMFSALYEEYVPERIPRPRTMDNMLETFQREVAISLAYCPGIAGLTAIEMDPDELRRLGIFFDEHGAISANGSFHAVQGSEKDRSCLYQGVIPPGRKRIQGFRYTLDQEHVAQLGGGMIDTTLVMFSDDTIRFELSQASSFRVKSSNGSIVKSYGSSFVGKGYLDTAWERSHPRTSELAVRVASQLSVRFNNIDSILSYCIADGPVQISVTKLLVPVRVVTPWVDDSTQHPVVRQRLEAVFWYLPTDRFFASLPPRVRSFIEPEYKAVVEMIERQLTQHELCEKLNEPSALGLCSVRNEDLQLGGIGPIPARESMTVFLTSRIDGVASVKLLNESGVVAYEMTQVHITSGPNQLTIPLPAQTLPQGAYTVVIDCAGHLVTSRVLIER